MMILVEALDKLYAQIFVRKMQWCAIISYLVLMPVIMPFAVLRPNDTLISVTGKPYDTLEEVIGSRDTSDNGSLSDYGINYKQVDLLGNNVDYQGIYSAVDEKQKLF